MIRKNILWLLFFSLSTTAAFSQMEIEEVSLTNLSDLNTEREEFSAVPFGKGIMYTTFNKESKCDDNCDMFQTRFAEVKPDADCGCSPSVAIPVSLQSKYNYGTPTFSKDGKMVIMTQNYTGATRKFRTKNLRLVAAELSDQNAWVNVQELPFNVRGSETAHPALSADGQTLYFASDREGGKGGMDIWKVMKQGDSWGTPMNLADINTAGTEAFPTIGADGVLYFSSNMAGGMGGLDIYSATMDGSAMNMGAPFNSAGDDLGYTVREDGESGYLSSNRGGGKGKDDLYCWKVNTVPVELAVEDASNSNRLQGATVSITGGREALNLSTDANGLTNPAITFRRTYNVNVEKEGYEPWSKEVTAKELAAMNPYIVPLVKRAFMMSGDVRLVGSESMVPGSKVVLHNKTTGEKREVIADKDGKFSFDNIHCVDDYELIAYEGDRESAVYDLPASAIDCSGATPITATLRLPLPLRTAPVCACNDAGMLSIPLNQTPKQIHTLGSRPEFGDAHTLDATGFFNKLQKRYKVSKRDATYLDELFRAIGYSGGFADASEYMFSETTIANGSTGNMGYTKSHRIQYIQLNAKRDRDLQAFRVSSANGCDIYFMKTCGNLFFICN